MPGYLAEALTLTPSVTLGPFYPLATNMPLDDDNDLAFFNPNVTAADGIVIYSLSFRRGDHAAAIR